MSIRLFSSFGSQTPSNFVKESDIIDSVAFLGDSSGFVSIDRGGRVTLYKVYDLESNKNGKVIMNGKIQCFLPNKDENYFPSSIGVIPSFSYNPMFLVSYCMIILVLCSTNTQVTMFIFAKSIISIQTSGSLVKIYLFLRLSKQKRQEICQ